MRDKDGRMIVELPAKEVCILLDAMIPGTDILLGHGRVVGIFALGAEDIRLVVFGRKASLREAQRKGCSEQELHVYPSYVDGVGRRLLTSISW